MSSYAKCYVCGNKIYCLCICEGGKEREKTCAMNFYKGEYPQSRVDKLTLNTIHLCCETCRYGYTKFMCEDSNI